MANQSESLPATAEEMKVTDVQEQNEASFSSLPLEVLEHVFSLLSRDDLMRVSAVCTTWRSIIYSSRKIWRSQKFSLYCHSSSPNNLWAKFFAQRFGRYFKTVTVKCKHHGIVNCRNMVLRFKEFLTNLERPALTSFKVSDLRMQCARRTVTRKVGAILTRMFSKRPPLKVFEMSSARWSLLSGKQVIDAVFENSRNTLETLGIDDYFVSNQPINLDWLCAGLTSLTRLSKLSINLFYLTNDCVVSLARARRGGLTHLHLWTDCLTPNSPFIRSTSWKYLTEACPELKVRFSIVGNVIAPHESLPAILDPVLPVYRLEYSISKRHQLVTGTELKMDVVLKHIANSYRTRLKRFELDIYNKRQYFDESLIDFVTTCPNLLNVKICAYFDNDKTAETVDRIVVERRQLQLNRSAKRIKNTDTDSSETPRLEDPMEGPSSLHSVH